MGLPLTHFLCICDRPHLTYSLFTITYYFQKIHLTYSLFTITYYFQKILGFSEE